MRKVMTISKVTLMFVCLLNLGLAADSYLPKSIPYALALGVSAYTGYQLYQEKGGDFRALTSRESLPYAAVGIATVYGCYSLYAHAVSANKLEVKLEGAQKAMTKVSLAHLQSSIEELEEKYEVPTRDGKSFDMPSDEYMLYHVVANRLKAGCTISSLEKSFTDDRETLRMCKNTLEITMNDKSNLEQSQDDIVLQKKLMYNADVLISYIKKMAVAFRNHKPFFVFEAIYAKSAAYEHGEERRIVSSYAGNPAFYSHMERYINAHYSNATHQFPFLAYVHQLEKEKTELEAALRALEPYKPSSFQQELIQEARDLLSLLSFLIENTVITDMYSYQKAQKPIFDRNEELHRQQLQERQRLFDQTLHERAVALENERKAKHSKLLKKENKAKELENYRLSMENTSKQQRIEKQRIDLQREAINNGQVVRDALDRNNAEWSFKHDTLHANLNSLVHQAHLKHDALVSSIEKECEARKGSILKVHNELRNFEDAFEVPPLVCNDDKQGVANYLQFLKRHLAAVQNALAPAL